MSVRLRQSAAVAPTAAPSKNSQLSEERRDGLLRSRSVMSGGGVVRNAGCPGDRSDTRPIVSLLWAIRK